MLADGVPPNNGLKTDADLAALDPRCLGLLRWADEQMADFERLAVQVCSRPGMFVGCSSFAAVTAFLEGFDVARDGGPLVGFHPWLVLRTGSGHNTRWPTLVLLQALDDMPGPDIADLSPDQNKCCIAKLRELLIEFFDHRRNRSIAGIVHDYAKWLRRKKWYDGPLRD
jgi:hypothetical protein